MERSYWVVRLGRGGEFVPQAREGSFIAIGWDELGDVTKLANLSKKEFYRAVTSAVAKAYKPQTKQGRSSIIGQVYRFVSVMQPGDIVIVPNNAQNEAIIGQIESGAEYVTRPKDACPYRLRRSVRWLKTIGTSSFSEKLRNSYGSIMTTFSISDHQEEVDVLLTSEQGAFSDDIVKQFALESHLEDFLVENWPKTEFGKRYSLIEEEGKLVGKQYVTPIGKIDLLAKSKDGAEWLVIELKKGKTSDESVGQLLRYMGWVRVNEASGKEKVRGIIVAQAIDEKLKYAINGLNDVTAKTYEVQFKLHG